MKQHIQQTIHTSLQNALKQIGLDAQTIDVDSKPTIGDYSSNIALTLFSHSSKGTWQSPRALAEVIVGRLSENKSSDYEVSIAGPGFINFSLSEKFLQQKLEAMRRDVFTDLSKVSGKKVIVEYSSPNIAKPFTVGHLRSTIIGEAIANLFEVKGYDVYRDNHLGDWGTQFGKLIYAIKTWGDIDEIASSPRPVKLLVELYVKFHEEAQKDPHLEDEGRAWFTKLEQGNQEARGLWQQCIEWSWKEFDTIYKELGCKPFSENGGKGYGESYFEDKMQPVIDELKEKGLLKKGNEGAQIVEFPQDELPPLMILKKDGSTLYATRDLATDKFRLEKYGEDTLVINEVGAEQSLYFKQLYKLEEMLGWYKKGQRIHVGHGFFRFKEGKMSTRKGNVIWLEDVLIEAVKRAHGLAKEGNSDATAHQVGIGALKWNDLKRSAHLDIVFDWDEILSMQGNCGPYIQYVAVRCKSILKKAGDQDIGLVETYTTNEEELAILSHLVKFSDVLDACMKEYAPHYLCTYLFELSQLFNSFYNKHQVLGQGEASTFRLLLTSVVGSVLENGLALLGIQTPEKM